MPGFSTLVGNLKEAPNLIRLQDIAPLTMYNLKYNKEK